MNDVEETRPTCAQEGQLGQRQAERSTGTAVHIVEQVPDRPLVWRVSALGTKDKDEQEWLPSDREENQRTQPDSLTSQQETRAPYQPYVDFTTEPDTKTALTRTPQLVTGPAQGGAPQEEGREEK